MVCTPSTLTIKIQNYISKGHAYIADGFIIYECVIHHSKVNGQKAKIIGEICMDMIFVDLTNIENVKMNDEVVIIGSQKNAENGIVEKITLRQMARWAKTIQDDVLTKFGGIKKTVG